MKHFGSAELKIKAVYRTGRPAHCQPKSHPHNRRRRSHADPLTALQQVPVHRPERPLPFSQEPGIPVAKPTTAIGRGPPEPAANTATPKRSAARSRSLLGYRIHAVDIVLWRFATISAADYLGFAVMAKGSHS